MRTLLLVVVLLVPSAVLAQAEPRIAAHAHVLAEIVIHGNPPTPITVFIPRARVHFDRAEGSHHAVDRIVESVARAPF